MKAEELDNLLTAIAGAIVCGAIMLVGLMLIYMGFTEPIPLPWLVVVFGVEFIIIGWCWLTETIGKWRTRHWRLDLACWAIDKQEEITSTKETP